MLGGICWRRCLSGAVKVAAVVVALLTAGCVTAPTTLAPEMVAKANLRAAPPSRFGLVYYPYAAADENRIASPHPDYRGWPDHRMRLDMERLRQSRVDLVLIHVDAAAAVGDRNLVERYREFIAHAEEAGLPYVLYGDAARLTPDRAADFARWCESLNLFAAQGCLKDRRRPIVWMVNGEQVVRHLRHIGLVFKHWQWEDWEAVREVAELATARVAVRQSSILLSAGLRAPGGDWILPRRAGDTLREGIAVATQLQPDWIILDSWNDYVRGSFIEPNSLDGDQVFLGLQAALAAYRQQLAARKTETGG